MTASLHPRVSPRISPRVSIVIPTHNRSKAIDRCLDSLAVQTYPADLIQIVVVADGCTDDTAAVIRDRDQASLLLIEQPQCGPALARNSGAARSTGELLLFIDDDMEASPEFVAAHVRAHQEARLPSLVIGYCPPRLDGQKGVYRTALLDWWELMFDAMAQPGRRFRYTDVLGGNISVTKALFEAAGGFDKDLWCHEDYELGYRLVEQGAAFRFEPAAFAWHNERTDMRRSLKRKFDEGKADVQIGRLHADVIHWLRLSERPSIRRPNWMRKLAWWPAPVRALVRGLMWSGLGLADRAQLRRVWRRLSDRLLELHYWMGVAEKLDTHAAVARFVLEAPIAKANPRPGLTVDVSGDLKTLEKRLDEVRPDELWIRFGDQHVGHVRTEPGTEWLHGGHLRPLLGRQFADELLRAMGAASLSHPAQAQAERQPPSPALRRVGSDIVDV